MIIVTNIVTWIVTNTIKQLQWNINLSTSKNFITVIVRNITICCNQIILRICKMTKIISNYRAYRIFEFIIGHTFTKVFTIIFKDFLPFFTIFFNYSYEIGSTLAIRSLLTYPNIINIIIIIYEIIFEQLVKWSRRTACWPCLITKCIETHIIFSSRVCSSCIKLMNWRTIRSHIEINGIRLTMRIVIIPSTYSSLLKNT